MALIVLRWIQCYIFCSWVTTYVFLYLQFSSPPGFPAGPPTCMPSAPHAHQNVQKETFFLKHHMPPLLILLFCLFIYLFIAIIFFSFSLGPDNPPHPWLISRKGTGSAVCSGLSFKNACSSSEHTLRLAGEQASSLLRGKRTTGR